MASEPLTKEREQEIREWLAIQDALYAEGGVWHGLKRESNHVRLTAAVAEIDRLREERDDWRRNAEHSAAVGTEMRTEISRLREELAIAEQENKEVRQGAERECDRLRAALRDLLCFGVELDDERLDYIVAHLDRGAVADARTALEGRRND